HEGGVTAARILGGHREPSVVPVQVAEAADVLEVLHVEAQRIGRRHVGAVLRGGENGAVGEGGALGDIALSVAAAHSGNSAGAVRIAVTVGSVDREAIVGVAVD